jgi:hypothetical protein
VERYHVRDDGLYFGARRLGSTTGLYADAGDFPGLKGCAGVRVKRTPGRIDLVFVAGDKVVGLESKRPSDLMSSQSSGRLARQVRKMRDIVDVPGVLLRGLPQIPTFNGLVYEWPEEYLQESPDRPGLWDDLVRLQMLGVMLLPGPISDSAIPKWLQVYRPILADTRNVLSVLARSDHQQVKSRQPGWFLTWLKGIGPATAAKLHVKFGSTRAALNASDQEWKDMGVGNKVIERRKEAML